MTSYSAILTNSFPRSLNKLRFRQTLARISVLLTSVVAAATVTADPQYQIYDIGVVQVGDTASQGFGISSSGTGGVAVGRSFRTNATQAYSWTLSGGLVGLPSL